MSHKYSLGDIVFKVRLTVRLLMDKRIAFYLKLIPIAALVYLVVPFDLIIGPIDDTVLLIGAVQLFISLCPAEIVDEHSRFLRNRKETDSSEQIKLLDDHSK
ncbi:MAG: hypothetical protein GYA18_08340 [Chloroflexi bacterium]|nr:hypothetical protein [Chloroflexota bacterium]